MNIKVTPSFYSGKIIAPSSKSETHRAIILACLSNQKCKVKNICFSQDTLCTLDCLKRIGAKFKIVNNDLICYSFSKIENVEIDCQESGTTLRFMLCILSALKIKAKVYVSPSLKNRPNDLLIECLNKGGANITSDNNCFTISGGINNGDFYLDASLSSQYISGMLLAFALLGGKNKLFILGKIVSESYAHITIEYLKMFGIIVLQKENCFEVICNKILPPKRILINGDFSSASTLICLGAINGKIIVKNLSSKTAQGDKKIVDILKKMNANIIYKKNKVIAKKSELLGIEIDCQDIPDLALNLSVCGAYAKGKTILNNIDRLKIKESDRLSEIENFLVTSKIKYEIKENSLTIYGGEVMGGEFAYINDHRVVMAQTLLASSCKGQSQIQNIDCVKKSYPKFFNDFVHLGGKIDGCI